jgi:hypothetical protein
MAQVIQLAEDLNIRALGRFIRLKNRGLSVAQIITKMGRAQYNLAEGEMVTRAGDPNRFDEKTGNWIIWP